MISRAELEHIAALARLRMGEDDLEKLNDMKQIIDEITQIHLNADSYALDMELTGTFREDVPKPPLSRQDVLSAAPETEAGCISVPKLLERGG
jgi:aspartyl-tRNA(Asn)/glutamyl-tRNA(Gln) amidotransferase subunit C